MASSSRTSRCQTLRNRSPAKALNGEWNYAITADTAHQEISSP